MRRLLAAAALLAACFVTAAAADSKDAAKAKKALQEVGEFVGTWNLTAETKASGKLQSWKETAGWSWKFKGDDAWLALDLKDGKHFTAGELRYLTDTKQYQLTATGKDGKPQVFVGEYKRGKLTVVRTDDKSGDVHRLSLNTLSEGVRMALAYEVQGGGKGLFTGVYKAVGNKDGESLAGGTANKGPECVVTGGQAKIAVSYMGKTYYVCCSGCKDEFDANPKKYVDALNKK
jgi:YHS domain-containing protein